MKKLVSILAVLSLVLIFSSYSWASEQTTGYENGVPVLAYHCVVATEGYLSVSPQEFDKQMKMLKDGGFHPISPEKLIAYLKGGITKLPNKPIVLTFDDGYEDNYLYALPILKKYGFEAAVFVISQKIGQPGYLSSQEIKELEKNNIHIGSHTMNHLNLTQLDSLSLNKELKVSKKEIEKVTDRKVDVFAYPYGIFDLASVEELKASGYQGAFTLLTGLNRPFVDDVYFIRRIPIFSYTDFEGLYAALDKNKPKESLLDYAG